VAARTAGTAHCWASQEWHRLRGVGWRATLCRGRAPSANGRDRSASLQ